MIPTPIDEQHEQHAQADRPLRADAARNRELVLQTARRLFAERGLGVTLNDIAHEAGVGVGTVYRRFPDKDAIIEALHEAKFASLVELAERAAAMESARDGLRAYVMGTLELRASDRALAQVIVHAVPASDTVRRSRVLLDALVTAIVERARVDGVMRQGFEARDVPMLVLMVGTVADRTKGCGPDVWRRYAQILVDGICPPASPASLLGEPLGPEELERAMHGSRD
ncbi:TetR/AcrR family transcriptional regulator [Curtobacterium sp. Leaf261]|uniref:TetR/AcrR family transcriptional regulator n=1 Tax=Curtobacterium sp. Leaf261 TaxID=1736311 RepID=UPI0009EC0A94|nr:TetR/AcrR family transcriptional regulator [Curtobacterium sp. Leaf261]